MMVRDRDKGLTLSEIVVALGVFGLVVLALIGLFVTNAASQEQAIYQAQGISVTQAELETYKRRPYLELLDLIVHPPAPRTATIEGKDYTFTLAASRLDTNPTSPDYPMLQLDMRTDWVEKRALANGTRQDAPVRVEMSILVAPGASL